MFIQISYKPNLEWDQQM